MTLGALLYASSLLLQAANAQKSATLNKEVQPKLTWSDCSSGSCKEVTSSVTVDASKSLTLSSASPAVKRPYVPPIDIPEKIVDWRGALWRPRRTD